MKKTVKRKKRMHIIFLPVVLCAIATVLYSLAFVMTDDTKAPEIDIQQQMLAVSVEADDAALLQGITANDIFLRQRRQRRT